MTRMIVTIGTEKKEFLLCGAAKKRLRADLSCLEKTRGKTLSQL